MDRRTQLKMSERLSHSSKKKHTISNKSYRKRLIRCEVISRRQSDSIESKQARSTTRSKHFTRKVSSRKRCAQIRKSLLCKTCNTNFSHRASLLRHQQSVCREQSYKCDLCDWKFTTLGGLKRHKHRHNIPKPDPSDKNSPSKQINGSDLTEPRYQCDVCKSKFAKLQYLKRHILSRHTNKRPYKCGYCDARFSDPSHRNTHLKKHTRRNMLKCDLCDKLCTVKSKLTRHRQQVHFKLQTHVKQPDDSLLKTFQCDECPGKFTHQSGLLNHKKCHAVKSEFKCTLCTASFNGASGIGLHLGLHHGIMQDKHHQCPECPANFSTLQGLRKHKKRHLLNGDHKCDQCTCSYSRMKDLARHVRMHHTRSESAHLVDTVVKSENEELLGGTELNLHTTGNGNAFTASEEEDGESLEFFAVDEQELSIDTDELQPMCSSQTLVENTIQHAGPAYKTIAQRNTADGTTKIVGSDGRRDEPTVKSLNAEMGISQINDCYASGYAKNGSKSFFQLKEAVVVLYDIWTHDI